jgi:hypothetical protein
MIDSMRRPSVEEHRMHRVENAMLKHINSLSDTLGAPVAVYADGFVMKQGKPTSEVIRCPFINPEIGVRLTHILNLCSVHVGVHHRENSSRFTDFALIFAPLELVTLDRDGKPGAPHASGPYTVRIEFKTTDEGTAGNDCGVMSDVRVADSGGEVDIHMIPDPEPQETCRKKSMMTQLGGLFKSAMTTSVRKVDRTRKSVNQFREFEDDVDDEPECYNHDVVQALQAWLVQEVAQPIEEVLRRDIGDHKGRGY